VGFEFKTPLALLLLFPYTAFIVWYWYTKRNRKESSFGISTGKLVKGRKSLRARLYRYIPVLRFIAVFLLILSLARPGKGVDSASVKSFGIDIMIALDISGSMKSEDFEPKNRMNVAKEVVKKFIATRPNDRIGLVIFAGDAYLQSPLTADHEMLADIVDEIDFDTVSEDGTAIGDALALCAARLDSPNSKGKVILLLTDGVNNCGVIDPKTAAQACSNLGIKIYGVGIGKEGPVPIPVSNGIFTTRRLVEFQFDPKAIKELTDITGGSFYRAESSDDLWNHIKEIDRLEKSDFKVTVYHEFFDRFQYLVFCAAILFMLEILLRTLVFRKIP
jgi:Ca-activated chloride channel family protein